MAEFTHESTENQEEEELQEEVLDFAPAALDDSLKEPLRSELIGLLQEFRDCFGAQTARSRQGISGA
ncbi:unnamed protein product [Prunus armeniaca]